MSGPATQLKRVVLKRAGQAYLAGAAPADAVMVADAVHDLGHRATLCYWNAPGDDPADITALSTATVEAAGERASWTDVAVKAPALKFDEGLVTGLAERCRDRGVRLWFDSHAPAFTDQTLDLAEAVSARGCHVGVALPARWLRSQADAARAMAAGLAVRVVKGQWPDPEAHDDVRASYLSMVERLAGQASFVGLATHDDWLLQEASGVLRETTTPFEIQLLHGLSPRRALVLSRTHDIPVRFYIPFGHPSLVYSFRTIWENRRHAAWLAQDLVLGSRKGSLLRHHR
jgi:proline dehydrogenase